MNYTELMIKNLLNIPLICFICGIATGATTKDRWRLPDGLNQYVSLYILFAVGLKGGAPLSEQIGSSSALFIATTSTLIAWGLFQPVLSFYLLQKLTRIDGATAAAIAACFGSVSIMTLVSGIGFLDRIEIDYQQFMIPILAMMEIPAILSGLLIAKKWGPCKSSNGRTGQLIRESLLNPSILAIAAGLVIGGLLHPFGMQKTAAWILDPFKPALCIFLFNTGIRIGIKKNEFRQFSWPLRLFGIYMPLIGGGFGLGLSAFLNLDPGTATLVCILAGSASYIAAPAAMRLALPEAKEEIYLPLSIGIAFPFNLLIGIPLYYHVAAFLLT